ncbi:asparagine synthase-related protein [Halobacillus shinanisalinarum]|uniref:asparagine synthase (glutamine-hydrolyzing) n=1 Tax=Halobacillus shinanisalinarum TaxID=2932258 RepID=A0ABY4H3P0_9BACI|nr:asparagine synthase-related protein [Halobacillus shinanisalinarum]UOQ95065.1 asparagine synthase-related protein [Halobacillus shinanisalinarum]
MSNWPSWINTEDHIGSQYPFYSTNNRNPNFSLNFNEILLDNTMDDYELDLQSIIDILMRGYIIGDKTLVKSIKRAPWLSRYNEKLNKWDYFDLPPHDKKLIDPKIAAVTLKELLYEEILNYIADAKRVGILLSGGMDSRILAGLLKETQINKEFSGDVVVYNWGVSDSRDVWYAKRIAEEYNWDYKHFPLNSDVLKQNFYLVQKVGAEVFPYNLHAMNAVGNDTDSDIVLAGSYGDTLGRAEYNGTPLKEVPPIVHRNANKLGLLKQKLVQDFYGEIKRESMSYRDSVDKHKREEYQYRETEYQRNHSRRYLTTAMSIIAMRKPLYQIFTSPKVVQYLWGLDLSIRSDILYSHILPLLPGEISLIPWARTGMIFGSNEEINVDNGRPSSHQYGDWLRNELRSFIESELDLNLIANIGIFNEKSLDRIYKLWPKSYAGNLNKLDATISWLTAFSIFLKNNNVSNQKVYKYSTKDKINSITVSTKIQGYTMIKEKLKNGRKR